MAAYEVTRSSVQCQVVIATEAAHNPLPHPQKTNDQVLKTSLFDLLPQDIVPPRVNQLAF